MAGRIEGKVAQITGGGSGIGRACAVRFAEEGAAICVADRDADGAAETVRLVEAAGGKAIAVTVDTTDEAANDAMVGECVRAFGGVDILVAAAGVGGARARRDQPQTPFTVLTVPIEDFQRVYDINLYGVLYSCRAAARWMVANNRPGSLITLGSIMSKRVSASAAYSISKAGVWMLTKVMASELAPNNIRVNAIGPGWVDTPLVAAMRDNPSAMAANMALTPMGRMGTPEEIAATALFLASDEASYFTGQILHPAGGVFVG